MCTLKFVDINWDLKEVINHFKEAHQVEVNRGLLLVLSDQNEEALKYLDASMKDFVDEAAGYPGQIKCVFCEDEIAVKQECGEPTGLLHCKTIF